MEEMNLSLLVAKNNIALSVNTSLTYAQLGTFFLYMDYHKA